MEGGTRVLPWAGTWLRAPGRDTVRMRSELERVLHDGAAAGMSALALELGLISMSATDPLLGARIDAAQDLLRRAIDDLRVLGTALYPPVLASAGLGPALRAVAEHRDVRLRLDLPRRELGADASSRVGLLVSDHLHSLCQGSAVRVRIRGRRLVRVHIADVRPGWSRPCHHRAVLRCA